MKATPSVLPTSHMRPADLNAVEDLAVFRSKNTDLSGPVPFVATGFLRVANRQRYRQIERSVRDATRRRFGKADRLLNPDHRLNHARFVQGPTTESLPGALAAVPFRWSVRQRLAPELKREDRTQRGCHVRLTGRSASASGSRSAYSASTEMPKWWGFNLVLILLIGGPMGRQVSR